MGAVPSDRSRLKNGSRLQSLYCVKFQLSHFLLLRRLLATNLSIFMVTIVALSSVMSLPYFTCSGTVNDCDYTALGEVWYQRFCLPLTLSRVAKLSVFVKDFFCFSLKLKKIKLLHSLQISHLNAVKQTKWFLNGRDIKRLLKPPVPTKEEFYCPCVSVQLSHMEKCHPLKGQVLFFHCWGSCVFLNIGDCNGKCWQNHQWSTSIQKVIWNLKATILPWLFWMSPPLF